jgi:hypothetical protein
MTLDQAVRQAQHLQGQIAAEIGRLPRLADIECSDVGDGSALAYLKFDHRWEAIAFRCDQFDREWLEQRFIEACACSSNGATLH